MKKITLLFVIGVLFGVAIAYATLPPDLVSRMYQSYVQDSDGNVALRIVFTD